METFGAFLIIFLVVFYAVMLAFLVLTYVLQGLGLSAIAKRRGINNPWLAWVPIGNGWMLGCISDQYQYVVKRQEKSKRKLLLGLGIATIVAAVVMGAIYGFLMGSLIMGHGDEEAMLVTLLPMSGVSIIMSIISIIYSVFYYMALYDLFRSCEPKNAVIYLILCIFVSVVQPFLLFACRNKDLGMPPRQPQIPVQPTWQPPYTPNSGV